MVGLQISIRESGDVTILDLQGRATIGVDSALLSSNLEELENFRALSYSKAHIEELSCKPN